MGRRRKLTEEEYYRQYLYGGWDPHSFDYVWLENGAYDQLERELAYYRRHPANVKPDELLRFLARVMQEWQQDKRMFKDRMDEVLRQYGEMLEAMRDREQVYQQLKRVLADLNEKLQRQERTQEQLDRRLQTIEEEKTKNQRLAVELRNEAVQAFNGIINDPYFQKYAMPELDSMNRQLSQIDDRRLADEARQAIAVDVLSRVYTTTKMVERKKMEYSAAQLLAMTEAALVIDQFEHWRDEIYFDEEKQHKADLDYWSFQRFSELMNAAQTCYSHIRDGELVAGYFVDELEKDLELLKELQGEGEETVASVFNNCNMSEQCEQLGLITAAILYEDFHFELKTNGYDDDDMRHGYAIEMENHAMNCKMRFVFCPVSQTQSVGCYQMCFDDYIDEVLLNSFEQVLEDELRQNGIQIHAHHGNGKERRSNIVDTMEFTPHGHPISLPEEMKLWEEKKLSRSS